MQKAYEFLIVGSGSGGATLARELSKAGKQVMVLERGKREEKVGTFRDCLRYYDATRLKMPARSKEGVILWRSLMAGGSTVVACGNATACLEAELAQYGILLEDELVEASSEMAVAPIAQGLLSEASERILWAAQSLGYTMTPMPKVIDAAKCRKCGQCALGCKSDAKWTALAYLDEADARGADIVYSTMVSKVLVHNGKAQGVRGLGPTGSVEVLADVIILAAGGLGTPVILQHSGIEAAGRGLFVDLLVNTYGVTQGLNQLREPSMALVDQEFHESEGFILSPNVNAPRMVRAMEMGPQGGMLPTPRLLGMMTKIVDESSGCVHPDGTVSKPVTDRDARRLKTGASLSTEILVKAGADPKSIMISDPQGAHPGGTAALGTIVDDGLQTEVEGLYVCDASVLPSAPGLPPILTLVALAKWLAKRLAA